MKTFLKWAGVAAVFLIIGAALSPAKHHDASAPSQHAAKASEPGAASTPTPPHRRHHRHRRATTAAASATPTPTAVPAFVACDANIRARAATTTCRFAENVFYEYYEKTLGYPTSTSVRAWSSAAATFFRVHCLRGTVVHCVAGDGAEIRFPSGAVAAYDDKQAAAYAASHDTGAAHRSAAASPAASDTPTPASRPACDSNYSGACLDPNSPDYDCEGGSGDGPDYTGEVQVVGDDHFELDRDGDGVACEPY
jgi:hypothetical protein